MTRLSMLLLLLFIALSGCNRKVAQSPSAAPPNPEPQVEQHVAHPAEEPVEVTATEAKPAEEEKAVVEEDPDAGPGEATEAGATEKDSKNVDEGETEPDANASEAEVAEEDELPRERILLLTRDGPLVIDVVMMIDGEAYPQAFEAVLDRAMSEADTDDDGDSKWTEMLDNPKFAYGQFGNLVPEDEDQRRRLIQMYDNNNDGLVDRDELPRFLTRNAGGSRAFSLRSSNEYHGDNRSRSPVRRLLDQDHDGAITADELEVAPARLFNRDADDDEILVLADFKDTIEQMQPQMSNRRRLNAPDTAFQLNDRTRWANVVYAMQETYAYGNRVGADDMPLTAKLIEQLDENENDLLDTKEIPQLLEVLPHLEFEVSFFNRAEGEDAAPMIRLTSVCEELQSIVDSARKHPTRISMQVPGAEVEFFVNDDPSLLQTRQIVSNQFNMLDGNNNGYIEEDEYSGQFLGFNVTFEAADADGNGMIYEDELMAFVEIRQSVMRAQIRARAADQEDALFTALDTDGDGRLTAREIYGSRDVLRSLDRNNDDRVQSHEIPGSIAVGFVRGNPQNNNNLFVMPAPQRQNSELPPWFRGMDTNGDGDISPREFLGVRGKFVQLDQDEDGFISADEIPVTPETTEEPAADE